MIGYERIQEDIVERYKVRLNEHSECRHRMHAHPKQRMVCKWHPRNSFRSTFDLMHEVGHIETHVGKMRRCESEYAATVWAIARCEEYGVPIQRGVVEKYQEYIWRELDRGVRRGGKDLPTKEELTLRYEE